MPGVTQDMEFSPAHSPFEAEQEAVVEHSGMVEAVSVADEGIGQTTEFNEPMPVGVVAGETRNLNTQHDAGVSECHFRGKDTPNNN
jgi:hypothetical protein